MDSIAWRAQYAEGLKIGSQRACPAKTTRLDLARAYALLAELPSSAEVIKGYKGALTTKESQAAFKTREPALGILMEGMELESDTVKLGDFNRGAVETEVGVILARDVTEVPLPCELPGLIRSCHLMIELVDLNFESPPSLVDLVLNNAAAKQYLRGPEIDVDELEQAALEFRLDNEVRFAEPSIRRSETLLDSLMWMLRQSLALGLPVREGQVWMAGAIGPVHAMRPGIYEFKLGADLDRATGLTFVVA